jgi:hypothetical protein
VFGDPGLQFAMEWLRQCSSLLLWLPLFHCDLQPASASHGK